MKEKMIRRGDFSTMTLEITVVQYKAESVRYLSFRQTIITRMLQRLLLQRLQV